MKLSDFSFPSGMPLGQKWAKHQQDGYVEALGATMSALCGPTEGFIVSGCSFNDVTGVVSPGWVYLAREFFYFPGATVTVPFAANLCFVIDDQPASAPLNIVRFFNGISRSPFRDRRVKLEVYTGADPKITVSTRRYWSDLVGLAGPWNVVGDPGQPPLLNGINGGPPPLSFRKSGHGYVQIFGLISLSPASAGAAVPIFTLPVDFRPEPTMDVGEYIYQSVTPLSASLSVLTIQGSTGTVSVASSTGGGSGRSVYINVSFRAR